MRNAILATIAVALLPAFAASASAQPGPPVTITTNLLLPSFPAGPPNTGTYYGTFSASNGDSGSVTAYALLSAVPSPIVGVFHTNQILTGANGTLELRCTEIAKSFENPAAVSGSGGCAVLSATGVYAGLGGSGKVSSTANFTVQPMTFTDTVVLGAQ